MEVLAVVQENAIERASAKLVATKLKLEVEHHKVISLEFELAGEQKNLVEVQKACTTANERWEEAMTSNEDLRDQALKDKEMADSKIAELEKTLAKERARSAFERAAYPDLCKATVEQFKESAEF
ncbi:hypothetical protein CsSME_00030682 [Camellia sinensis var. sinensis]